MARRVSLNGPLLSVFPECFVATLAAAAAQSMRFPQIVKRSISSRSFLGVLCFSSEFSSVSPSSSLESETTFCSCSGGGVGGRQAGAGGEESVGGGGNRSVLGVGCVVTEGGNGGLEGAAGMS